MRTPTHWATASNAKRRAVPDDVPVSGGSVQRLRRTRRVSRSRDDRSSWARQNRLLIAGTVAALAATVLLFGGTLREEGGARALPVVAAQLEGDFASGDTEALVAGLEAEVDDRTDAASLTALGLAYQQRARETADASYLTRSEAALLRANKLGSADATIVVGPRVHRARAPRVRPSARAREASPRACARLGAAVRGSRRRARRARTVPQAFEAFDRARRPQAGPHGVLRGSPTHASSSETARARARR